MVKTVMEKADEILANMGISDSVPLAEASTESLNAVGKKYDDTLPELNDSQREAFLEGCGIISETLEPAEPGNEDQETARKAQELVDRGFRSRRTVKDPYQPLTKVRKAVNTMDDFQKGLQLRRTTKGNTNPTNPRNKISPTAMSVPGNLQKIKSGLGRTGPDRFQKPKTRVDTTGETTPQQRLLRRRGLTNEETELKFKTSKRQVKADSNAQPTEENPVVIVNDGARVLRKVNEGKKKKPYSPGSCEKVNEMINIALGEMTSVGSIGVNMAGAQSDPMKEKPKKAKKKKGAKKKATNKFLNNTFKELY